MTTPFFHSNPNVECEILVRSLLYCLGVDLLEQYRYLPIITSSSSSRDVGRSDTDSSLQAHRRKRGHGFFLSLSPSGTIVPDGSESSENHNSKFQFKHFFLPLISIEIHLCLSSPSDDGDTILRGLAAAGATVRRCVAAVGSVCWPGFAAECSGA